ncbi:MAG: beta-ketoacyl-[acyl-carrier-protein] synthase II, partial [Deltaproteobacteria bacterium]|nr:beta-ketoacyl-[acyl-carrier-protein] synthase II [Deltaproteobacteria bacterium]
MGVLSPLGIGLEANWDAISNGRSGIGPVTKFDASDLPSRIAGEVRNFNAEDWVEKKEIKKMDPFLHYTLAAGQMAVQQSGLVIDESNAERVGVLVGSGLGGLETIEKYHTILLEQGTKRISPFFIPMLIVNLAP